MCHLCVSVNLWVQLPQNPEEGVRSLGATIRKGGTLPGTGARNWTQLLLRAVRAIWAISSVPRHTHKIYRQLKGTLFIHFHSILMIKFSKYCKELGLPETGLTRLYFNWPCSLWQAKCLVTNKGRKIFIFWASTEVKSQPFHSLNGCTYSLRSSFKLVRKGGGWSLPSPNFYYWLKTCS